MKNTFGMDDAVIPVYYPSSLVRWLENQGYDRSQLIAGSGLKEEDIDSPKVSINFHQHQTLITNALNLTGNEHLGLYFGQQLSITSLGIVGLAVMSSDTFDEGLGVMIKYMKLRAPLILLSMDVRDDTVHVKFDEALDYGPIRLFMYEAILSANSVLFESIGIERLPEFSAKLTIPEPDDWDIHKHVLGFQLEFDADVNEYSFATEFLQQKIKLAEPATARSAIEYCDSQLKYFETQEGLINRLNNIISQKPGEYPSLDSAAEKLFISSRTLRRELNKMGTTFQEVLDQNKRKLAIRLLQTSNLSMQEIAEEIGYNDPSNFSRAFRRWTGKPPSDYRK